MLTTVLLAALAEKPFMPITVALGKELWAVASALMAAILFMYKLKLDRAKEKADAAEQRLKKIEEESNNNTNKHTAAQLERERLVDKYNEQFSNINNKIAQVDRMSSEMNDMKTKVEVMSNTQATMLGTMNEMKSDSKAQFKEIIDLIKAMPKQ